MIISLNVLIAFLFSLCIAEFTISEVIQFSKKIKLGDAPESERKIHKKIMPNLAGIGIFLGTMVSYFAFSDYSNVLRPDKIFSIMFLLFFVGLKDDIDPIAAWKRIVLEFLCAFFIIYITNIRITSMYGIFGVTDLPYWASFLLTSIFIVGCINAYNMIDGIDGLLGSLSFLGAICCGIIFNASSEWLWTLLCVTLTGSLISFLIYNWQPAKIFMGNGGSMLMGTLFACFSLRIMQMGHIESPYFTITMPHTIALGIIAIPVFDMLSVFLIRILRGNSPFKADRNHTHHHLLELGLQHWQATLTLVATNIVIILFAYFVQQTGALRSLIYTMLLCVFLQLFLFFLVRRHRSHAKKNNFYV